MAGSPQRPPVVRPKSLLSMLSTLAFGACLASCGLSSASVPRIDGAVLTTRLKPDGVPVDSVSSFATADTALHCVAVLDDGVPGTMVRGRWSVVSATSVAPGRVIGTADLQVEKSGRALMDFVLTPKSGLPVGSYRVDLFLNPGAGDSARPDKKIEFSVVSNGPRLANAFISADPNGKHPRTTFTSASEVIYCQVALVDGVVGTKVTARWLDSQGREIDRTELPLRVAYDDITFSLKPKAASEPGTYRVEVFVGSAETPDTTLSFSVTP